ncbi:LCA5L protein, partial [Campylorhamphus procurvoides]|nr:LCA5L protein [Campylorhamphus procurvoides]
SRLTLQSTATSQSRNAVAQQIVSARIHRIKELKNEIFDIQRKIEAASLENQTLRQLHQRQLKAIERYKTSESNFQDILARHYDEVRDLRNLLRVSKESERNTSKKVRRVEAKLLKAKDALQTLHVLSDDKGLAGRDELNERLSVLTQTLEGKDETIQSLEMQLKLNNNICSRRLASENKKMLEAVIVTKNLKMEINSLHQKIKEIDRQLYRKNIYANRMPKALKDSSDLVPQEQGLSVNRAVQVDKESFRELQLSQHQDTEKSPIQLIKGEKSEQAAAKGANSDAQDRTENQPVKKILMPETSNRAHREYLREGRLLTEEHTFSKFMKEKGKETKLLKKELQNLVKTEQSPQSDGVKDNNHEGDAVEELEREEKPEEQTNSEKGRSEGATPNKTPTPSEATEDLQQGLLPSGPKCRAGRQSRAGQGCSGTAASREQNSFGLYEPSFGKDPRPGQKDRTTGEEGCAHVAFAGRKKQLMEELFGAGAARRDNPLSPNTTGMK